MKRQSDFQAENFIRERKRHTRLRRTIALLCAIVMLLTMNSLKMNADTLEHIPGCGLEEHRHTLECYPLICPLAEAEPQYEVHRAFTGDLRPHVHTEDCYDDGGVLACGYVEGLYYHVHSRWCYDDNGNLVCGLSEIRPHVHTEACYQDVPILICGQDEYPAHHHTPDCYFTVRELACGQEENPGHIHTDACYYDHYELTCGQEESVGHIHTSECYIPVVETTCGQEEGPGHIHTAECYTRELICGEFESEAHQHTDACYANVLTCEIPEGYGAHTHTESCYTVYNILVCGIPEGQGAHKHTKDCVTAYHTLVCGIPEGEGAHRHTDNCYINYDYLVCGQEETDGHTHTDECYEHTAELICGEQDGSEWASMMLGREGVQVHTHTDDCFTTFTRVVNGEERKIRLATCGYLEIPTLTSRESDWTSYPVLVSPGHAHTAECYDLNAEPVCGMVEHEHTDACYQTRPVKAEAPAEGELIPAGSENGDADGVDLADLMEDTGSENGENETEDLPGDPDAEINADGASDAVENQTPVDNGENEAEDQEQTEVGNGEQAEVEGGDADVTADGESSDIQAADGGDEAVEGDLSELTENEAVSDGESADKTAEGEPSDKEASDTDATDGEPTDGEDATDGESADETADGEPSDKEASDTEAIDGEPTDGEDATDGEPTDGEDAIDGESADTTDATDGEPTDGEDAADGEPTDGEDAIDGEPTDADDTTRRGDVASPDQDAPADGEPSDKEASDADAADDKTDTDAADKADTDAADEKTDTDADAADKTDTDADAADAEPTDGDADAEPAEGEPTDEPTDEEPIEEEPVEFTAGERVIEVNDGSVTLAWGPEAEIPEDVRVEVVEIERGTPEYDILYNNAMAALSEKKDTETTTQLMRFFDITLYDGDEKIEPKAAISVTVKVNEAEATENDADVDAIHMEDVGAEAQVVEATTDSDTVSFEAESFSIYGVVVDVPATEAAEKPVSVAVDLSSVDLMEAAEVTDIVSLSIPELLAGTDGDAVQVGGEIKVDTDTLLEGDVSTPEGVQVEGDRLVLSAEALDSGVVSLEVTTYATEEYETIATTHKVDIELSGYQGRTGEVSSEDNTVTVTALGENSLPADATVTVTEMEASAQVVDAPAETSEENTDAQTAEDTADAQTAGAEAASVEAASTDDAQEQPEAAAEAAPAVGFVEGSASYDITITNANEDVISETGLVKVVLQPENLNIYDEVPSNAVVKHVSYTLIHEHEGETTELPVTVEKDRDGKVTKIIFEAEKFSTSTLKYTVDFEYIDEAGEKHTWSFPGTGSHKISEVLAQLGIQAEEITSAALELVEAVGEYGDKDLYLTHDEDGEWWINSDAAFDDTYELTVEADGRKHVITVTDNPELTKVIINVYLADGETPDVDASEFTDGKYYFVIADNYGNNAVYSNRINPSGGSAQFVPSNNGNAFVWNDTCKVSIVKSANGNELSLGEISAKWNDPGTLTRVEIGNAIGAYTYTGSLDTATGVYTVEATKLPDYTASVAFVDVENRYLNVEEITELPDNSFYVLGKRGDSYAYFAPVDKTAMDGVGVIKNDKGDTVEGMTGITSVEVRQYTGSDVNLNNVKNGALIGNGEAMGNYLLTIPTVADGENNFRVVATQQPERNVNLQFKNAAGGDLSSVSLKSSYDYYLVALVGTNAVAYAQLSGTSGPISFSNDSGVLAKIPYVTSFALRRRDHTGTSLTTVSDVNGCKPGSLYTIDANDGKTYWFTYERTDDNYNIVVQETRPYKIYLKFVQADGETLVDSTGLSDSDFLIYAGIAGISNDGTPREWYNFNPGNAPANATVNFSNKSTEITIDYFRMNNEPNKQYYYTAGETVKVVLGKNITISNVDAGGLKYENGKIYGTVINDGDEYGGYIFSFDQTVPGQTTIIARKPNPMGYTVKVVDANGDEVNSVDLNGQDWYIQASVARNDGTYIYTEKISDRFSSGVATGSFGIFYRKTSNGNKGTGYTVSENVSFALLRPKDGGSHDWEYFSNTANINTNALDGSSVESKYTLHVDQEHHILTLQEAPNASVELKCYSGGTTSTTPAAPALELDDDNRGKYYIAGEMFVQNGTVSYNTYAMQELGSGDTQTLEINNGLKGKKPDNGNATEYLTGRRFIDPVLIYAEQAYADQNQLLPALANGSEHVTVYHNGDAVEGYRLVVDQRASLEGEASDKTTAKMHLVKLPTLSVANVLVGDADASNTYYTLTELKRGEVTAYALTKFTSGNTTEIPHFVDAHGNKVYYQAGDAITNYMVKSTNSSLPLADAVGKIGCTRYAAGQMMGSHIPTFAMDGTTITTTLKKVTTTGYSHTVNVQLYQRDNTALAAADPTIEGDYYVLAWLTPKTPEDSKQVVGYTFYKVEMSTLNASGVYGKTIPTGGFKAVDADLNVTSDTLGYDPDLYKLNLRLYKKTRNWGEGNDVNNVNQITYDNIRGGTYLTDEAPTGYDFQTPTTNGNTSEIKLRQAYEKVYKLKVHMDKPGLVIGEDEHYVVRVKLDHYNGDVHYAYAKLVVDEADTYLTFTDDGSGHIWRKTDGTIDTGYNFTGNEKDVTLDVLLLNGSFENAVLGNLHNEPLTSGDGTNVRVGESLNKYTVAPASREPWVDDTTDGTSKTIITDVVNFVMDDGDISKGIIDGYLETATDFGLYTEILSVHGTDMESNIGAAKLTGQIGADYGFSGNNLQINRVKVVKKYVGAADGTVIKLRLYPVDPVTGKLGAPIEKKGVIQNETAVIEFDKLVAGTYVLKEVVNGREYSYDPATNGIVTTTDGITISFNEDKLVIKPINVNVNYFGQIDGGVDLWSVIRHSRNGTIVSDDPGAYTALLGANGGKNEGPLGWVYQTGSDDFPTTYNIPADMAALRMLSKRLGRSTSSQTVRIVNKTLGEINGQEYLNLKDDGRFIVVNVDVTGAGSTVKFNPMTKINGVTLLPDFGHGGNEYASRVLYNFITRDSSGNPVPYTGHIDTSKEGAGVLLAPSAVVGDLAGNWGGTIICHEAQHTGSEIHSDSANKTQNINTVLTNSTTEINTGDLELQKVIFGESPDRTTWFTFEVTLKDENGAVPTVEHRTYTASGLKDKSATSVTFDENGELLVQVRAQNKVLITGIPEGYTYTVQEVETPETEHYQLVQIVDADGELAEGNPKTYETQAEGTIEQKVTDVVKVVNAHKVGGLTIGKIVKGGQSNDEKFKFVVTLTDENGNPLTGKVVYKNMTFINGVAVSAKTEGTPIDAEDSDTYNTYILLGDGESITAKDIPTGYHFHVEEQLTMEQLAYGYVTETDCALYPAAGATVVDPTKPSTYVVEGKILENPDNTKIAIVVSYSNKHYEGANYQPKVDKSLVLEGTETPADEDAWPADGFTFTLSQLENPAADAYTGAELPAVTGRTATATYSSQKAVFGQITFTGELAADKVYTYKIVETIPAGATQVGSSHLYKLGDITYTDEPIYVDIKVGPRAEQSTMLDVKAVRYYKEGDTPAEGDWITENISVASGTITNKYEAPKGSLTITKTRTVPAALQTQTQTFNLAVKDSEGTYYNQDGTTAESRDAAWVVFTLPGSSAADYTKTWSDLPAGTYTVEEQDASETDYIWTVTGLGEVTVAAGEPATATVENHYDDLTTDVPVTKTWSDNYSGEWSVTFELQSKERLYSEDGVVVEHASADADWSAEWTAVTDGGDEPQNVSLTITNVSTEADRKFADLPKYRVGTGDDEGKVFEIKYTAIETACTTGNGRTYTATEITEAIRANGTFSAINATNTPDETTRLQVAKQWSDGNAHSNDEVTMTLVRYKADAPKYALNITHSASGALNALPTGFSATYTVKDSNGATVDPVDGVYSVIPGTYYVYCTVVDAKASEGYTVATQSPVEVVIVNQAGEANFVTTYTEPAKTYGTLAINHAVIGLDSLPSGFTYTVSGKTEIDNPATGTEYTVETGEYAVTVDGTNAQTPTGFSCVTSSSSVTVTVSEGESATANFTSTYTDDRNYGNITIAHVASGLDSTALPSGFAATYTIAGPTTISSAVLGQPYRVLAGDYTVTANVTNSAAPSGKTYVSTSTVDLTVSKDQSATATLTSEYEENTRETITITVHVNATGAENDYYGVQTLAVHTSDYGIQNLPWSLGTITKDTAKETSITLDKKNDQGTAYIWQFTLQAYNFGNIGVSCSASGVSCGTDPNNTAQKIITINGNEVSGNKIDIYVSVVSTTVHNFNPFVAYADEDTGAASSYVNALPSNYGVDDSFSRAITLNAGNNWTELISNLPVYDEYGQPYYYGIVETAVNGDNPADAGYTVTYNNNPVSAQALYDAPTIATLTAINTPDVRYTRIKVDKQWFYNGSRVNDYADVSAIYFNLYKDDVVYGSQPFASITADNGWTWTSDDLPEGTYTVKETNSSGVEITMNVDYENNGQTDATTAIVIKNTLTHFEAEKRWEDKGVSPLVHPAITLNLYKTVGGSETPVGSYTIAKNASGNDLKHKWENLPVVDYATGNAITYHVTEEPVPGFTAQVNDGVVTNTLETINIPVSKAWLNNGGNTASWPSGIESVTVTLYRGDTDTGRTVILSAANPSGTFTDVPKYVINEDGTATLIVDYRVVETAVDCYDSAVSGDATSSFTVTNTPRKTQVTVTKSWSDGAHVDNDDWVKVRLYANGSPAQDEETLNNANGWTKTWSNLPMVNDATGLPITYAVVETGYHATNGLTYSSDAASQKAVTGPDASGNYTVNIKNTLGQTIDIEAVKTWTGGSWPANVTVEFQLKQNDLDCRAPVPVTANTKDHKAVWTTLPEKDDSGADYTYTVVETVKLTLNGQVYTFESGKNYTAGTGAWSTETGKKIWTINNALATVDVPVRKTWATPSNTPYADAVQMTLYANDVPVTENAYGVAVSPAVLNAANGWVNTAAFVNLPQYDEAGDVITYSVQETGVSFDGGTTWQTIPGDYFTVGEATTDSTNGGYSISNTPVTTGFSFYKLWKTVNGQHVDEWYLDDNGDYKPITVQIRRRVENLYDEGFTKTVVLTPSDSERVIENKNGFKLEYKDVSNGHYRFAVSEVDKYDTHGNVWVYEVQELSTGLEGYVSGYNNGAGTETENIVSGISLLTTNTLTNDRSDIGTIINWPIGYSLPATGGMGTTWIYIAGASLLMLAVLGFIWLNRKRDDGTGI